MVLVIESIEIDTRITKRISPLWRIVSVCMNKDVAIWELLKKSKEIKNKIGCSTQFINDELLVTDNGARYASIKYFLREEPLYGSALQNDIVYHLIARRGYLYDYDYPFGFINLGWFTDMDLVKNTREWVLFSTLKEANIKIEQTEFALQLSMNKNWISDKYFRMQIESFQIIR